MQKRAIVLNVNDEDHQLSTYPNQTLLDVLREDLELTGAKRGCEEGSCGTCTVLVDGVAVRSCLTLAVAVQKQRVTTIEGLQKGGEMHPIQEAFIAEGAVQCGFCTAGMILTARALLDRNPTPTAEEILWGISGNLCRCTGYYKIKRAIMKAAGGTPT